ncbi:hypothetical protein LSUE1_G008776 [Lachnellula suecica]|uniref:Nitrogen regulatory protein areA GATA-like domain-containing protein n=1 Tax=Lachnellula suecica TaxID=602035 RepID=A0A8T9BX42_9HELO|nr:hypothetical protein LSUE1_G008776 [Lachnellula suecica]
MSLLLPKGIVKNSEVVEGSIERVDNEALDLADIAKMWKVYTTTKRRLLDPTAERLENYWWRIWGSRKRELKGATVARLFAQISDGRTFVPLRGPPNRDEGTTPLERTTRFRPAASSATTIHQPVQNRPRTTPSSGLSRTPIVMPHPILKKARGPSSTGPRPTARFVSPHDSELETAPNSPVGTNSHVVVQPPSPLLDTDNMNFDKKSGGSAGAKKKSNFVASNSSKKKRPVIVRRQSSQSSAELSRASGSTQSALQQNTSPTVTEQSQARGKQPVPSKFQENFSPSSPSPASTAPKKDRAALKSADSKRNSSRKSSSQRTQNFRSQALKQETVEAGPSNTRRVDNDRIEVEDLTADELELQQTLLEQANASRKPPQSTSQTQSKFLSNDQASQQRNSQRSTSEGDRGAVDGLNILHHDRKSSTSLAPTLTTATGNVSAVPTASSVPSSSTSKGKGKAKSVDSNDNARAGLFTKQPVQPTPAGISGPAESLISRSKSQLTLLLEKDRAKGADNKPTNGKKKS